MTLNNRKVMNEVKPKSNRLAKKPLRASGAVGMPGPQAAWALGEPGPPPTGFATGPTPGDQVAVYLWPSQYICWPSGCAYQPA